MKTVNNPDCADQTMHIMKRKLYFCQLLKRISILLYSYLQQVTHYCYNALCSVSRLSFVRPQNTSIKTHEPKMTDQIPQRISDLPHEVQQIVKKEMKKYYIRKNAYTKLINYLLKVSICIYI